MIVGTTLWDAAVRILRENDLGGWTKPAPRLYPHQWSWDSAFVAIGLARIDPDRALRELETLFAAQWADGRVPHIVYNPAVAPEAYFPDGARWACAELSVTPPRAPATSGLIQPPVHALGALAVADAAAERGTLDDLSPRLRTLFPKLVAWHRYLATARDPDGTGLVTIYHPWESGTDNSPRWDAALANVVVGAVPPYIRRDLQHVADPSHRPTDAEYDRYLWLVESLKAARYDDARVHATHPFLIRDVLFSAIFAAAGRSLADLAGRLGESAGVADVLAWSERSSAAVQGAWDADEQLALDYDVRAGRPVLVRTWSGLAPLILPRLDRRLADRVVRRTFGPDFVGADGLAYAVVPSTVPGSPGFDPRSYWRGPTWPIANWLLWRGLRQHGYPTEADGLRAAGLAQLDRPEARFAEYFEPFTAEPLGSLNQSWTAAVALDWLAELI
ncbi:MAG: glycogen debranching protein [Chloroflexota bacterium]|nr:glycogen debranching protein [Chloroflexota bacterium]